MIKYFSVLYDGLEDIEKIEFEYYKEDINWNFGPKNPDRTKYENPFLTTDSGIKSVPPFRPDSSLDQKNSDKNPDYVPLEYGTKMVEFRLYSEKV